MLDLILASAHHVAVFTLVALFAAEFALLRPGLGGARVVQLARIDAAALRDPSAGSGGAPGGLDAAGGATTRDGGATDSGTDAARVDARGMADDGGRDLDRDGPAASR